MVRGMTSNIEIEAVERVLARLFGTESAAQSFRRNEAIEILEAAKRARQAIDGATQIPPACGERQICQCPVCQRRHWRATGDA
ncbi:hypothetical protein DFR50_110111 [Roseiarcus fermentans]|uniref:Uncharacterized protein n=1 Tax=Roseiarcus fermentans TaxID=1473586 RepID=A0A366FHK1_9HYPH|nr:hypothetical protein [Roseiarcus fermentans]RBP14087.1 hypothetical protein DFR50_110111 [Roseiarcus fermentans]